MRRLSGVVVWSRETKEKRTSQPGVGVLVGVYLLPKLLARISSRYMRKGAVPALRQNIGRFGGLEREMGLGGRLVEGSQRRIMLKIKHPKLLIHIYYTANSHIVPAVYTQQFD